MVGGEGDSGMHWVACVEDTKKNVSHMQKDVVDSMENSMGQKDVK